MIPMKLWMKHARERAFGAKYRHVAYLMTSSRTQRCSDAPKERRATRAARLLPNDWRPGRAVPAPPAPRTACTGTTHCPHDSTRRPPSRLARRARCGLTHPANIDVFCREMYRAGRTTAGERARTARRGAQSCALRHASISTISCVLPQPVICRAAIYSLDWLARRRVARLLWLK